MSDARNELPDESEADALFDSLHSIIDGASLFFVTNLVVNGVKFLLNFILARGLGVELYGLYVFGQKIVTTVVWFVNLGSDISTVRYISANLEDLEFQNDVLGLSLLTSVISGTVVAAGIMVLAPYLNGLTLDDPSFTPVLRAFAIVIPLEAVTRLAASTFTGQERPKQKSLINAVKPVLRLLAIGVAVYLGASAFGVAVGYAVGALLTVLFAVVLFVRSTNLRPSWGLERSEIRSYFNYSLPITFSRAGSILHKRIDFFMIGFFLASADVGVYNIALVLSGVIAIPLAGFNQFFPPVASRLYSDDDKETLESVFQLVTRWSITVAIIIALVITVYRLPLLGMFGEAFQAGATVTLLFVFGQVVNAASGPSNDVLTMTDHQYVVLANHWGLAVLNAVFNYLLIQEFGIVGAALATSSVLGLTNIARVVEVWYLEGLFPYSVNLWKPVVAAPLAFVAMEALKSYLSGLPLIVAGGALGVTVYLGILYLVGIEEKDKEFIVDYVAKFQGELGR